MKSDVLQSHEQNPISWSEAEALIPFYGPKGSRLLCIPRKWTPPFTLWPERHVTELNGNPSDEVVARAMASIESVLRISKQVILRSSVIGETIWDRGTYESIKLAGDQSPITWLKIHEALKKIVHSTAGRKTAVIVQVYLEPSEFGEFGNILRVSKTRDQWELSTRTSNSTYQTDRVNTQRDSAPLTSSPLAARSGVSRERFFGPIGAWINNNLVRGSATRVNCEWILSDKNFWLVQLDGEDEDFVGINPHQLPIEAWPVELDVKTDLIVVPSASDIQKWDKLLVLDELSDTIAQHTPRLYLLHCKTVFENRDNSQFYARLEAEFTKLFGKSIMIRTSGPTGREKQTNLPRTECLTPSAALAWCVKTVSELCAAGGAIDNLAFVVHRFIASRASAWVRVDPKNPVAEIHGTWGLPDALQFCAYDNWEVHTGRQDITEYPDYKSHILLASEDGKWRYERVRNDIARHQSLTKKNILEIATRSASIAARLGRPMHIMWFVSCAEPDGQEANIPWYWTEAHKTDDHAGRLRPRLFKVTGYADLDQISSLRSRYSNLAIDLQPKSIDLFRDNDFLKAVSDKAIPDAIPVYLKGSSLCHAYYQLQKNGCVVIPAGDKDHLRVRKHVQFGKLVRDGVPEKIAANKEHASTINVPASVKLPFLIGKFLEELLEVREAETPEDKKSELADVFEVLRGLVATSEVELSEIVEIAERKKAKLGGFDAGAILLETSMPTAQNGDTVLIPADTELAQIRQIDNETFELPFSYLGFSQVGAPKTLRFENAGVELVLTLNKDHIRISVHQFPIQMKLDF